MKRRNFLNLFRNGLLATATIPLIAKASNQIPEVHIELHGGIEKWRHSRFKAKESEITAEDNVSLWTWADTEKVLSKKKS